MEAESNSEASRQSKKQFSNVFHYIYIIITLMQAINPYIDHTLLKPEASKEAIKRLCTEAATYGFAAVCILPIWVTYAAEILKGSQVKICSVAGFPLGSNTTETKVFEATQLVSLGAHEIDMVININALKSENYAKVQDEISAIVACSRPAIVKVIIETCLLTDSEKVTACQLAKDAGAQYVKTSTGFSTAGATLRDVALMRQTVGEPMGVKASGGIRDYATAVAMIDASAPRLGTSSGVAIANFQIVK